MIEKQYTMKTSTQFARTATLLVRAACKFTSKVMLVHQEKSIDLKNTPDSIIDVMSLGMNPGSKITIKADGDDEDQALKKIEYWLSENEII
ncbi:HPr family phosphocarrier protein [Metabacillus niabensis]|uniref:HPr family phosphocarrier protein n=1 Tax=Metabacillus niabensis TaxID=324854 RepID=UPI0039A0C8E3